MPIASYREQFTSTLSSRSGEVITRKEIMEWFSLAKADRSPAARPSYASECYTLLIEPLLAQHILERVGHGLYLIANAQPAVAGIVANEEVPPLTSTQAKMESAEDDFDSYIASKLK